MIEIPLGAGLLYICGFMFGSYVWARVVSMAVFKSWSQVCSFKCSQCYFYHSTKAMEVCDGEEKEERKEEQKEGKEQKQTTPVR